MMRRLGPSNQGSVAMTTVASVTALSLGLIYVLQSTRHTQQAVNDAMSSRARELGMNSNISNLALMRSLLTESQTPDKATHEPAIFPKNYFAMVWDLEKNTKFNLPAASTAGSAVTVRSFSPTDVTMDMASNVFNAKLTQLSALKDSQTLEIIGYNPDKANPYYIASIDVKARRNVAVDSTNSAGMRNKEVTTYGRIPLAAPTPLSMRLRIKEASAAVFTENFGTMANPLPPGKYVIQMVASGVVHHGTIEVNGNSKVVGLDNNGTIIHGANNVRADSVIGDTGALDFAGGTEASSNEEVTQGKQNHCDLDVVTGTTPGTGAPSVDVHAHIYAVDGRDVPELAVNKTIYIKSPALTAAPSTGGIACENACPASTRTASYDAAGEIRPEVLDRSLSGRDGNDVFDDGRTQIINTKGAKGVICASYTLMAQEMKQKSGMRPSDLLRTDPARYSALAHEGMELREYSAFLAPACKREVVGTRSGCGCFAADTQILMADGSVRPASEIRAGDFLWNPRTNRAQEVKRVIAGPEKIAMISVEAAGKSVLVTSQHPFLTKAGLRPANRLEIGDVLIEGGHESVISALNSVEPRLGEALPVVWNFELIGSTSADDHYVVANGVMTGDLFLQIQLSGKSPERATISE